MGQAQLLSESIEQVHIQLLLPDVVGRALAGHRDRATFGRPVAVPTEDVVVVDGEKVSKKSRRFRLPQPTVPIVI